MDLTTLFIIVLVYHASATNLAASSDLTDVSELQKEAHAYIRHLFVKYGDGQVMTFEGFEHLLSELGLGKIHMDHDLTVHRKDAEFVDLHTNHNHAWTEGHHHPVHHHHHQHSQEGQDHEGHAMKGNHSHNDHNHDHELAGESHGHDVEGHDRGHDHSHEHGEGYEYVAESVGSDNHESQGHQTDVRGEGQQQEHAKRTRRVRQVAKAAQNDVIATTAPPLLVSQVSEERIQTADEGLQKCLSPGELLATYKVDWKAGITESHFLYLGPALITQMEARRCSRSYAPNQLTAANHTTAVELSLLEQFQRVPGKVWLMATCSVVIISLVGLVAVAMIPLMQRVFYQHLIQFLVALAIGSLTGDALLHLMPHAISPPHSDQQETRDPVQESHATADDHSAAVWKGMMALAGIYAFFVMERTMALLTNKKKKQLSGSLDRVPAALEDAKPVGTRVVLATGDKRKQGDADEMLELHASDANVDLENSKTHSKQQHHQGQGHGHSHEVPQSVSAVVWMVIMGDGLHNFTDGLAIGAAFVSSVSMGFSTTVAVFCHELPHELGDFAMLLHGGMRVKQALFYNIFSSILCLLGMVIGIFLGNVSSASSWIFALTAGIFLYIALVDMLPQLTDAQTSRRSRPCYLLLQLTGIGVGISVMLAIALLEDDIKAKVTLADGNV